MHQSLLSVLSGYSHPVPQSHGLHTFQVAGRWQTTGFLLYHFSVFPVKFLFPEELLLLLFWYPLLHTVRKLHLPAFSVDFLYRILLPGSPLSGVRCIPGLLLLWHLLHFHLTFLPAQTKPYLFSSDILPGYLSLPARMFQDTSVQTPDFHPDQYLLLLSQSSDFVPDTEQPLPLCRSDRSRHPGDTDLPSLLL